MRSRNLKDRHGVVHQSVEISVELMEKPISWEEERRYKEYIPGLRYYLIDGHEVSEQEFFDLFPDLKP
jgi:hypothetical protein